MRCKYSTSSGRCLKLVQEFKKFKLFTCNRTDDFPSCTNYNYRSDTKVEVKHNTNKRR